PCMVCGSIRGRLPASGSPFGLPSCTSYRRTKSYRRSSGVAVLATGELLEVGVLGSVGLGRVLDLQVWHRFGGAGPAVIGPLLIEADGESPLLGQAECRGEVGGFVVGGGEQVHQFVQLLVQVEREPLVLAADNADV